MKIYGLQLKNFPTRLDFLTEWSNLVADHADISEGLNDSTLSGILQIAVRWDPAIMTMFSNFLSLRKLQNKPENNIPYEELFDRIQTDFLTLDSIKPHSNFTHSVNMGASHNADVPSDDDYEGILSTLVNLGVSEDTLDCVQSDLDVHAARQNTRTRRGRSPRRRKPWYPDAEIPEPWWKQLSETTHRDWSSEDPALRIAIFNEKRQSMRAKAPAVKNKDLATIQHSANNAIMDDDSDDGYKTAHDGDVQCNSSNLVAYATNTDGDPLFYDVDDEEDPDAILVARAASTKPAARNRSRSTQQKRPLILKSTSQQPKPQEDTSEKHPLGSMANFLSNPTKILVDEQGEL